MRFLAYSLLIRVVGLPVSSFSKRWGLGTRRWFSKVNMAASGKKSWKTSVFWTKDCILLRGLTSLGVAFYFDNITLIKVLSI